MNVFMVEKTKQRIPHKTITLALVTITQKKTINKKSLRPNNLSLWLEVSTLNLVNKK